MSKDKLVVTDWQHGYAIFWWLDDGDDYGASIGEQQGRGWEKFLEGCREDRLSLLDARTWWECERIAAEDAANGYALKGSSFVWDSRNRAEKCLRDARRFAKIYVESDGAKAWPEWAQKALAAGWKPPRGWKP